MFINAVVQMFLDFLWILCLRYGNLQYLRQTYAVLELYKLVDSRAFICF